MLTFAVFFFPALAIGTMLWLISGPLASIFGPNVPEQAYERNPQLVRELAYKRFQGDEYETLITMEFQPLGPYYESYGKSNEISEELIFEHRSLPVFAVLCQSIDKQRYVTMLTEGAGKMYLHSSSSSHAPEVREANIRLINSKAEYIEDVLETHMKELSQWEEEGFLPSDCMGLAEFAKQIQGLVAHPYFATSRRGRGISMTEAYLLGVMGNPREKLTVKQC